MTSNLDAGSKRDETLHSSPGTLQRTLEAHVWDSAFSSLDSQPAKPDCLSPAPKKPLLVHSLVLPNFLQCYSIYLNLVLGIWCQHWEENKPSYNELAIWAHSVYYVYIILKLTEFQCTGICGSSSGQDGLALAWHSPANVQIIVLNSHTTGQENSSQNYWESCRQEVSIP